MKQKLYVIEQLNPYRISNIWQENSRYTNIKTAKRFLKSARTNIHHFDFRLVKIIQEVIA